MSVIKETEKQFTSEKSAPDTKTISAHYKTGTPGKFKLIFLPFVFSATHLSYY